MGGLKALWKELIQQASKSKASSERRSLSSLECRGRPKSKDESASPSCLLQHFELGVCACLCLLTCPSLLPCVARLSRVSRTCDLISQACMPASSCARVADNISARCAYAIVHDFVIVYSRVAPRTKNTHLERFSEQLLLPLLD